MSIRGFDDRLAQERRARLQAERLLAQRSEELYAANKKLAEHAHALSHKVIAQRADKRRPDRPVQPGAGGAGGGDRKGRGCRAAAFGMR